MKFEKDDHRHVENDKLIKADIVIDKLEKQR
jgi:hypothetical protein